jgi:hypothetical protein
VGFALGPDVLLDILEANIVPGRGVHTLQVAWKSSPSWRTVAADELSWRMAASTPRTTSEPSGI